MSCTASSFRSASFIFLRRNEVTFLRQRIWPIWNWFKDIFNILFRMFFQYFNVFSVFFFFFNRNTIFNISARAFSLGYFLNVEYGNRGWIFGKTRNAACFYSFSNFSQSLTLYGKIVFYFFRTQCEIKKGK